MKHWIPLVASVVICISPGARAADGGDSVVKLDKPLSTSERILTADQIGRHLRQMNEGTSTLPKDDQRLVLESALHSLVKAITPESMLTDDLAMGYGSGRLVRAITMARDPEWKETDSPHYYYSAIDHLIPSERARMHDLRVTYQRYLNPATPTPTPTGEAFAADEDALALMEIGVQLVALNDRLRLAWRNLDVTWALPTFLFEGLRLAGRAYLKSGDETSLDKYFATLSALRTDPNLSTGPEVRNGFDEFMKHTTRNLHSEHTLIDESFGTTGIDMFSIVFTTTWLSAVAVTTPVALYDAFANGPPTFVTDHPAMAAANVSMLVGLPIVLNIVARGRRRERAAALAAAVNRLLRSCENALTVADGD